MRTIIIAVLVAGYGGCLWDIAGPEFTLEEDPPEREVRLVERGLPGPYPSSSAAVDPPPPPKPHSGRDAGGPL